MDFIRWFIGLVFSVAVVVFAISNRHAIEVFWSPFTPSIEVPFYLLSLSLLGTGFVIGALCVWLNESGIRRDRRRQRKEIKKLQAELGSVYENNTNEPPSSEFFPALPKYAKH